MRDNTTYTNCLIDTEDFFMVEENNDASIYAVSNMNKLVRHAMKKFSMSDYNATTLVDDVVISLLKAEKNGNGYDMNAGNGEGLISVEQFVYGRLNRYAKNVGYRLGTIEIASSSDADSEFFSSEQSVLKDVADSISVEDYVISSQDIKYDMELCVSFGDDELNIEALISNLSIVEENFECDNTVFMGLRSLMGENVEFSDAFKALIKAYGSDKEMYEQVLKTTLA